MLICEKCELVLGCVERLPEAASAAKDAAAPPPAPAAPPGAGENPIDALMAQLEPGSARRAAVAVLAAVTPGGLPLSDVLRRALALHLFTPQLPGPGRDADVAAWAEMSAALTSDDAFVTLSPGVFALRSLLPSGTTTAPPRPHAALELPPVVTLNDDQLRARLAASPALRQEAEALLRMPSFHRAAREARASGDATALARHLAMIRPERELARCPEVYLALANSNYGDLELGLLWHQLGIAADEMSKAQHALEAERQRRIAAESRAVEAIDRAVKAETREAAVSRRAVAIVRRAGMDPYELLFEHDAEAGDDDDDGQAAGFHAATTGLHELADVAAPLAPLADDATRAMTMTPGPADDDEGDAQAALSPPGADADVTGDAPSEPPEEAMPEAAAAAAGAEKAESPLEAPQVSEDTVLDLPAAADAEEVAQHAAPSPTGGDAGAMEDVRRKRDAAELQAEEPLAKAARVDDEPACSPEASGGGDCGGVAAAPEQRAEEEVAAQHAAPLSGPEGAAAESGEAPAAMECREEPTAVAHAAPLDCSASAHAAPDLQPVAAQGPGRGGAADCGDDIVDSTAAASPVAPDAPEHATAASADASSQLAPPPAPSGQMCLCRAVAAESVARGDVMVRCSTCAQPFHPKCCGYPAALSAAAVEAMRPPFSCYDHREYFPPPPDAQQG